MKAQAYRLEILTAWQRVFLQSKVNGAPYQGDDLSTFKWCWPENTYLQRRLQHLRMSRLPAKSRGSAGLIRRPSLGRPAGLKSPHLNQSLLHFERIAEPDRHCAQKLTGLPRSLKNVFTMRCPCAKRLAERTSNRSAVTNHSTARVAGLVRRDQEELTDGSLPKRIEG
jgi:hypothetical protein